MSTPQQHKRTKAPYELIPTEWLACPPPVRPSDNESSVTSSNSSTSTTLGPKELSEKSGLAILKYVLMTRGELVFNAPPQRTNRKQQHQQHKETFYLAPLATSSSSTTSSNAKSAPLPLWDKMDNLFSRGVCQANIRHITKDFLVANGVRVSQLIEHCGVSLPELHVCGILKSGLDDLLDLGFELRDLTRDKALFSPDHLVMFFGVTYEQLRRAKRFSCTILDIQAANFHAAELKTLDFSFHHMIKRGYLGKEELAQLNFSLTDLRMLGLEARHLEDLGISERDATRLFRWDRQEYREFANKTNK